MSLALPFSPATPRLVALHVSPPFNRAHADARIRDMFGAHANFVWRNARRLGLSSAEAEDTVQQVFLTAVRRIDDSVSGKERSFLLSTTYGVAANIRRSRNRRREDPISSHDLGAAAGLGPEEATIQTNARAVAERILEALDEEQRTVFILFELEEMTMAAIAEELSLPAGTVASRLRRARERFHELTLGYKKEVSE